MIHCIVMDTYANSFEYYLSVFCSWRLTYVVMKEQYYSISMVLYKQ